MPKGEFRTPGAKAVVDRFVNDIAGDLKLSPLSIEEKYTALLMLQERLKKLSAVYRKRVQIKRKQDDQP